MTGYSFIYLFSRVARVGNDNEFGVRVYLDQIICRLHRAHHVVTTLYGRIGDGRIMLTYQILRYNCYIYIPKHTYDITKL